MVSGRTGVSTSTLIEPSAPAPSPASRWTTASSKLNASPYEEYMATREKKAAGVAVAPEAEEKASKFESYQASRRALFRFVASLFGYFRDKILTTRNEQASMPPAEKEKSLFESYMASRGMSSAPQASEAPAPAPAPEPSSELSPYEAYMKSREKVKAAEAATTFEEKTKASAYEEYMAQRKAKEGGEILDCAEEECEPEVVEQEASLFTSYMASRGIKVDAAPELDCAEEECTPEEQVSYYDSYMASRKNVKEANADVTPQEKETVSMFDSYMASRNKSDQARSEMPPAQAQKKLFEEYEEETPS
ncbi:unnamed protein product [Scytosiphon promiscuus]